MYKALCIIRDHDECGVRMFSCQMWGNDVSDRKGMTAAGSYVGRLRKKKLVIARGQGDLTSGVNYMLAKAGWDAIEEYEKSLNVKK